MNVLLLDDYGIIPNRQTEHVLPDTLRVLTQDASKDLLAQNFA
jgi:hypothetical protein